MMSGRVLLLGENNPYGSDPQFALYCYPPGCAGYRLRRIFGLPQYQYLGLHRANLCEGDWTMGEARRRAKIYTADPSAPWRVIVMLGRKVADAFDYDRPFFTHDVMPMTGGEMTLVSLPHPSGRNTVWNDKRLVDRARDIMRELAPDLPWGSADVEAAA